MEAANDAMVGLASRPDIMAFSTSAVIFLITHPPITQITIAMARLTKKSMMPPP